MNAKLYPARALDSDSCLRALAHGYSGVSDTAMNIESACPRPPCVRRGIQKAETYIDNSRLEQSTDVNFGESLIELVLHAESGMGLGNGLARSTPSFPFHTASTLV